MKEKVKALHLQARKNKDLVGKLVYEDLTNALLLREKEEQRELTDSESVSVLQKTIKQHQETLDGFNKTGNKVSASEEQLAIDKLKELLPSALEPAEVEQLVLGAMIELGLPAEKRSQGAIVKRVIELAQGRTDGRAVSAAFQVILNKVEEAA